MDMKILFKIMFVTLLFATNSCVMDENPLVFHVKNCTGDTLLVNLTKSDTLNDGIYCGTEIYDTAHYSHEYVITIMDKQGNRVLIWDNYDFTSPNSSGGGIYPLENDSCYMYAIKWNVATNHSFEEIREKKLYDRRVLTKKDFDNNRQYEYRYVDSNRN